ncbi:unnamed protein product, partial [Discosporangium mesarthrocarpum]
TGFLGYFYVVGAGSINTAKFPEEAVVAVDAQTLTSNMRHWTNDYAVMFYAPWCAHCKSTFGPMWTDLGLHMAAEGRGKDHLVMGKFNCEGSTRDQDFCVKAGVTHYPTFMLFGSGSFPDSDPVTKHVLHSTPAGFESSVKFPTAGLIYPEVLHSWVRSMQLISRSHRWAGRVGILGWGWGR